MNVAVASCEKRRNVLLAAASITALLVGLLGRIAGPSDVFHQTQPKTVGYTTDIIVRGDWLLPRDHGRNLATKPPLYNWAAVPFVRVFGFDSELAHKMPSILALIGCWGVVVWVGERRVASGGGWLAGMMFATTYATFKLGYLARPDMLTTLWVTIAWASSTELVADHQRQTTRWQIRDTSAAQSAAQRGSGCVLFLTLLFWVAVSLAFLTKGPVGVVPIVCAAASAFVVCGRAGWVSLPRWKVLPIAILPFGLWLLYVHRVAPAHLLNSLWGAEFYGRVIGTGSEAPESGPMALLATAPYMPFYFLLRGAPWSVLAIAAMVLVFRRPPTATSTDDSGGSSVDRTIIWLRASCVWVGMIVLIFTFSAGKRADYIAAAFAPGVLLATWGWRAMTGSGRLWWSPIPVAAATLATLIWVNQNELTAPGAGYSRAFEGFVASARAEIRADPAPLVFRGAGENHLQAFLGSSIEDTPESLRLAIRNHERFWLIAGDRFAGMEALLSQRPADDAASGLSRRVLLTEVAHTPDLPRWGFWPGRLTLYRVERMGALD